jgi:UDP-3-O-acyl-N-acetylglucosamine deacetylase
MNISPVKIQLNEQQMMRIAKFEEAIQKKRTFGVNDHIKDFKQAGRDLGKIGEEIVVSFIGGCVD